jgi:predicted amidophosphoribosyltransferase
MAFCILPIPAFAGHDVGRMLIETAQAEGEAGRLARLGRTLRAACTLTLGAALPQLCPACREPVEGPGLCATCWARLSFIAPPFCERLGTPFAFDAGAGLLSLEAIADPPAYRRARAVVRYDDIAGRLVHALKYGDRLDLAPMMARWMATAGRELLAEADLIVPVPLHWRRQWARRFNQSALLAEIIGKSSGRRVAHSTIRRVKATPQQVGLDKTARAQNVRAHSASRPPEKQKLPAASWCSWTMCLQPAPLSTPVRAHSCGAVRPVSMCWCSRVL